MPSVGDLFVRLGFDVDDAKLKGFDTGIKNLKNSLALISVEAIGTVYALERIATKSMAAATQVMNLKNQFGIDPKTTMFWETTGHAKNPALSTEAIDSSLASFAKNLVQWQRGGMPKWLQNDAHVNARDSVESAMEKLRDYIQHSNRSPAWKSDILQQAGIDPGFMNVLKMSRKDQEALFTKEHGGYDVEKVAEAAVAVSELNTAFTNLSRQLTVTLVPVIEKITDFMMQMTGSAQDKSEADLEKYWKDKMDDDKKPRRFWNRVGHDYGNYLNVVGEGAKVIGGEVTGTGTVDDSLLFGQKSMDARRRVIESQVKKQPVEVHKLLGYKSEDEMRAAEQNHYNKLSPKDKAVYDLIRKGSKPKPVRAIDDPDSPAIDINPTGQPGALINTPQPSDAAYNKMMEQNKKLHPDDFIDMPPKPAQTSSNSVKIDIHAGNADAREVAQETSRLVNTYTQFNNAAVV